MKEYVISQIRNVGIVSHAGSGKTSLAEAFLYNAGAISRLGKVEDGNTVMDHDVDEANRGMSISTSLGSLEWKGNKINILDTPGNHNFLADTYACLPVIDSMIMLVDAVDGVKFQTAKIWESSGKYALPCIFFVNKMDAERADFQKSLDAIKNSFPDTDTLVLNHPMGKGDEFFDFADLMNMTIYDYSNKRLESRPMSQEQREEFGTLRERMVEAIVELDEGLMERYLEGEEIKSEELINILKQGVMSRRVTPVITGSATKNIGVEFLLDYIVKLSPSPDQRPPVEGKVPESEKKDKREPDPKAPFSALVFKTIADPYAGQLTLFRVFSGSLESDSLVFNSSKGEKERFGQVLNLQGKTQRGIPRVSAGDFAAIAKLKYTSTGDTLCSPNQGFILPPIQFPEAVISFAIRPKTRADEEKVSVSLQRLMEEDPTIRLRRDPQTKELIISGMGDIHIEVIIDRLKRKFGVDVDIQTPKVPYKETIRSKTKAQGKYKRQSGGRGQYGDTWQEVEPLPRGEGFEFVDKIVGGVIPKNYIPAVEKGIREAMDSGPVAGYPVTDIKTTLYDGSFHDVDSSDMAFKIAASMGFKKAVGEAKPVLLEPIMNIEVFTSEEHLGDVIGDLNSRRGKVHGIDAVSNGRLIRGEVPMAEVLNYSASLTSITGGTGSFTMSFSRYQEVPHHISQRIIEEAKKSD